MVVAFERGNAIKKYTRRNYAAEMYFGLLHGFLATLYLLIYSTNITPT